MDFSPEDSGPAGSSPVTRFFSSISRKYQSLLDASTPHMVGRWVFAFALSVLFMIRVIVLQGWYIICYALGIYYLNLFIAFLTPKIDPVFEQDDDEGPSLPTSSSDEFRPFMRRLPEFKFWHSISKATVISIFCTFFEFFNIPVFWPILLLYFCVLFGLTMKRQIMHMLKYKYLPWSSGKTKYAGKEDTGKVINAK